MTKIEAIKKIMNDNGGSATWDIIYDNSEKYYPAAKISANWQAGIRGIVLRELGKHFKRVGLGIYALIDFEEENIEKIEKQKPDKIHSIMQGVCLEIGNFLNLDTYTADPSATYNNITLNKIATRNIIPEFTYKPILESTKKIDILWFNKKGFLFPKRAIEIVDSIGTLEPALKRTLQLLEFNLDFFILSKEEYKTKIEREINKEPYIRIRERYKVRDYSEIIALYKNPIAFQSDEFLKIENYFS
ncbi:MAG: hypothetical protein HY738_00350 [Bacteroidia bacterium]|nr:hypothetical protein [Bacteroidia bacterium]